MTSDQAVDLPQPLAIPARALGGRTAVVTGAGRGIGRAIAFGLARAGAHVCAADVDGRAAQAVATEIGNAGGRAFAVQWDIADPAGARTAVEATHAIEPRVTILINKAGIEARASIGDADCPAAWRRMLSINLDGTMLVTQALATDLKACRGCIVNVLPIQSSIAFQPQASAYSISKAALAQLPRALAN